MIDGALPYLRCPVCEQTLRRLTGALRCPRGHSFDLARQGYADLSAGRLPHAGDTPEMVADRAAFLAAGHYAFVAEALADAVSAHHTPPRAPGTPPGTPGTPPGTPGTPPGTPRTPPGTPGTPPGTPGTPPGAPRTPPGAAGAHPPAEGGRGLIVDAGTGTGDYLARVLAAVPSAAGLGVDVSKPALRRAARAHPRAAAIRADLWRTLPLVDGAAAVILNVFAPRNGAEYHRILRPGGLLLVVTPAAEHLRELVAAHGLIGVDPDKAARVSDALDDHFAVESGTLLRRELRLSATEVRTLIGMTPSAHHVPVADLPTAAVTVTAAVDLTTYRPRVLG
jgi:23S rRNA (guanine745-N1)-methyltransferase